MADDHKPGFKDLFSTIKKSPALMVTFIAAALIIGYILIKKGPSGTAQTAATDTNSGLHTGGGSYIQPYIEPIIIQSGGGPSPVPASGGGDGGSPPPTTGITMPPPSSGSGQGTNGTTNSSAGSGSGLFYGILGPNVAINTQNKTYTNASGQTMPLPIPTGATVVQGSSNRVWYTYQGNQYLLTSGNGGPQSSSYATGVPVSTANGGGTSSSTGTTNQQNNTVTKNVNTSSATTNSHG